MSMDVESFYGLAEPPFSSAPDERFYYDSPQHSKALIKLMHAAERMEGLVTLVGDIGTGKTTLARRMLDMLSEQGSFETILLVIIHPEISSFWFLRKVAALLGVDSPSEEKGEVVAAMYRVLLDLHERGRKPVVLVDEANMLQRKELMEEIRGLLNIELQGGRLLTFFLFGLPDMEDYLRLDEPLQQRIAMRCRLDPLERKSVGDYIRYRLQVAGREDELFTDDAIDLISDYSQGRPRVINTICNNALLEGAIEGAQIIERELIDSVARDLDLVRE
ncbi:hypothetical protein AMJ39_04850 [candidate division TA06 bacterium DG_24]|jgi:general secretion pathway protein A|uniref:ORC1/DEAH AAA+ ATPase domain-containing protein n=3 Tax=Bacteria division TA06 TaxID=1156500 RepID=A0A0S8JAH3_UNCT6|nr:MAG: hypothetical protein AMJ39_04850 [candidate division TA06 bacterium DG_24]KPK68781.1 MAG: hypothetical protein AMJ82_07345 [candidate division TA06 bacterium SM23_40]KPL06751.1 MAG: hypothetical protein AMJ71_09430 [candidate division TA06 bacterium SM1_40]